MRTAFVETLKELAREDSRIFLLTADMGFSVFETFREEFPDRFLNTGIAEQNTIGIAAGLAARGKIVFVYSIIPFVTMRCFEQFWWTHRTKDASQKAEIARCEHWGSDSPPAFVTKLGRIRVGNKSRISLSFPLLFEPIISFFIFFFLSNI